MIRPYVHFRPPFPIVIKTKFKEKKRLTKLVRIWKVSQIYHTHMLHCPLVFLIIITNCRFTYFPLLLLLYWRLALVLFALDFKPEWELELFDDIWNLLNSQNDGLKTMPLCVIICVWEITKNVAFSKRKTFSLKLSDMFQLINKTFTNLVWIISANFFNIASIEPTIGIRWEMIADHAL